MKTKLSNLVLAFLFIYQINPALDTLQVKEIGPGVIYYKLVDSLRPLSIDVLKVDLKNKDNYVDVFIPFDTLGVGGLIGTNIARYNQKNGKNIIAGVNADFFGGEPMQEQNSLISNGELIKGANLNRSLILIDSNNVPQIGKFKFIGDLNINNHTYQLDGFNEVKKNYDLVLVNQKARNYEKDFFPYKYLLKLNSDFKINKNLYFNFIEDNDYVNAEYLLLSKKKIDDLKSDSKISAKLYFKNIDQPIKAMVGGLPGLFTNSQLKTDFYGVENLKNQKFIAENPRTAVGYNKSKDTLIIVTVDGRQPKHSMGMNLYELSRLMKKLGCTDALNLDGGGSTVMVMRDSLINKPSDIVGERVLFSMLLVLSREKHEVKIEVKPKFKEIMLNHTIDFEVNVIDEWGFKTQIDSSKVQIKIDGIEASLNNKFEFIPNTSGNANLIWNYGSLSDTTDVVVIPGE